ncbi:hypothetical protein EDB84DRAFT_1457365, partial [Lactarius hengduanensis]
MNAFRPLLSLFLSLRCCPISYSDKELPLPAEGSRDTGNVSCSENSHLYLGSASRFGVLRAARRRFLTERHPTTERVDPPNFGGSRRCGTRGIRDDDFRVLHFLKSLLYAEQTNDCQWGWFERLIDHARMVPRLSRCCL